MLSAEGLFASYTSRCK